MLHRQESAILKTVSKAVFKRTYQLINTINTVLMASKKVVS